MAIFEGSMSDPVGDNAAMPGGFQSEEGFRSSILLWGDVARVVGQIAKVSHPLEVDGTRAEPLRCWRGILLKMIDSKGTFCVG